MRPARNPQPDRRRYRRRFVSPMIGALCALFLLPGCTATYRYKKEKDAQREELAGFEYDIPLERLWPEARRLLRERGYEPLPVENLVADGKKIYFLRSKPMREYYHNKDKIGWLPMTRKCVYTIMASMLSEDTYNVTVEFKCHAAKRDTQFELELLSAFYPRRAKRVGEIDSSPSAPVGTLVP